MAKRKKWYSVGLIASIAISVLNPQQAFANSFKEKRISAGHCTDIFLSYNDRIDTITITNGTSHGACELKFTPLNPKVGPRPVIAIPDRTVTNNDLTRAYEDTLYRWELVFLEQEVVNSGTFYS